MYFLVTEHTRKKREIFSISLLLFFWLVVNIMCCLHVFFFAFHSFPIYYIFPAAIIFARRILSYKHLHSHKHAYVYFDIVNVYIYMYSVVRVSERAKGFSVRKFFFFIFTCRFSLRSLRIFCFWQYCFPKFILQYIIMVTSFISTFTSFFSSLSRIVHIDSCS